MKITG